MAVKLIKDKREYIGASGDTKPTTDPRAGDDFYEYDTGKHFVYTGSAWTQYANNLYTADVFPIADNTYVLGSAPLSYKELHVQTIVYLGAQAGDWVPSVDGAYDIGENVTPREWQDAHFDGIVYMDDASVPSGFSMVSEVSVYSHFDHDNGAWDFFTKTSGAAELSRLRITHGTDEGIVALANAWLLFGHNYGIQTNAANGTVVNFQAYENGAYVTIGSMNSSATEATWTFYRPTTIDGLLISNDGTKTTLIGPSGDYTRIGDAGTTGHSLASEDDLLVTGKLEVDGASYFDALITAAEGLAIGATKRLNQGDNSTHRFGDGDDSFLGYRNNDANAKMIHFGLPHVDEDANNVAVLALIDVDSFGTDLGAGGIDLSGITEPTLVVGNEASDSYLRFGFSGTTIGLISGGGSLTRIDYDKMGMLNFNAEVDLTISAGGAVAVTQTYHSIVVNGGIGSGNDDLATATGGSEGDLLILKPNTSGGADTVTVKDGAGANTFKLAGGADFVMDHIDDRLWLIHNGTEWVEISRSSNS